MKKKEKMIKIGLFHVLLILGIISFILVPYTASEYDSYIMSKKPMCGLQKIKLTNLDELIPKNLTTVKEGVTYNLSEEYFKNLDSYKKVEDANKKTAEYNNQIDSNGCLKEEYKQQLSKDAKLSYKGLPLLERIKLSIGSSIIYWYFWLIPFIFLFFAWYVNNKKNKNENRR